MRNSAIKKAFGNKRERYDPILSKKETTCTPLSIFTIADHFTEKLTVCETVSFFALQDNPANKELQSEVFLLQVAQLFQSEAAGVYRFEYKSL